MHFEAKKREWVELGNSYDAQLRELKNKIILMD